MMEIMLSILIPSTPDRKNDLSKLLECILSQEYMRKLDVFDVEGMTCWRYYDLLCPIEILVFEDAKIMTIGEKREWLYKYAKGTHSWQIDSDDLTAPNAIQLILEAIRSNPDVDVISFEEFIDIDGKIMKSNHHGKYIIWEGDGNSLFDDGYHFHRTPFFKSVIRTALAKSVSIPHVRFGEDHRFADNLLPRIKTETHINQELYKYIHRSSNHETRYGFDKD